MFRLMDDTTRTYGMTNNRCFVWFSGSANAQISYEMTVNYEWIPTENIDIYNVSKGPIGDPSKVAQKIQ